MNELNRFSNCATNDILTDTYIYIFYESVFVALVKINLILYATHHSPTPAATPQTIFFNYDHVRTYTECTRTRDVPRVSLKLYTRAYLIINVG